MSRANDGLRAGVLAAVIGLAGVAAYGQDAAASDKDKEIVALRQRVEQLEKRLAALETKVVASGGGGGAVAASAVSPEAAQQARRAKFEARMRKDGVKYSREQVRDAEQLYQVANKQFGTPEAKAALEKMVQKYPDLNRTGCAVLYMGQMSKGEEREKYLTQAAEKYADCMYGDGVVVGAFARYLLAEDYEAAGKKDMAEKMYDELEKKYPDAVDHSGKPLMLVVKELRGKS